MEVILYSTKCPKCLVLEKKLNENKIPYQEITDVDLMSNKGFMSVPKLEVDGTIMDFSEAIKWVNVQ